MNVLKLSSTPVITAIDGHQAAMTPVIVQPSLPQNLNNKGKEGILGEKTTITTFRKHYLICKNVLCKFKDRIDTNAKSNFIYRDVTFHIKIHQRFNTKQHRGNLDTQRNRFTYLHARAPFPKSLRQPRLQSAQSEILDFANVMSSLLQGKNASCS